jgi:hypothetical protein
LTVTKAKGRSIGFWSISTTSIFCGYPLPTVGTCLSKKWACCSYPEGYCGSALALPPLYASWVHVSCDFQKKIKRLWVGTN